MSQELTVNTNFWSKPPWADLKGKYRLGLKPIELSEWFDTSIGKELKQHKKQKSGQAPPTGTGPESCQRPGQKFRQGVLR